MIVTEADLEAALLGLPRAGIGHIRCVTKVFETPVRVPCEFLVQRRKIKRKRRPSRVVEFSRLTISFVNYPFVLCGVPVALPVLTRYHSTGSFSDTVGTTVRAKCKSSKLHPGLRRSVALDDATTASFGSSRSTERVPETALSDCDRGEGADVAWEEVIDRLLRSRCDISRGHVHRLSVHRASIRTVCPFPDRDQRVVGSAESSYSRRWCSAIPNTSKPTWSACSICSTKLRRRSDALNARLSLIHI